ncbi:MAG: cyclic nucleotide-binding domain-containing protein [Dehalococcoidia bacterium]|nr:cyclic nucleotide-binding domain-containing protein [Dehalococcoidia bacterium]
MGKVYKSGEPIFRQGDTGDCMYVIQEGQADVICEEDGQEVRVKVLGKGEMFGEMAVVDHEVRSATVRASGEVRVLTIDRKTFLRRLHEDPSLAIHMVQIMSARIRALNAEVTHLRARDAANPG